MQQTEKVKFAVVGCGHIGKRHAQMVVNNPEAELVAICDTRPESELQMESFGARYYSDLDELLSREKELDVVNIATPNGLHSVQAVKALNAGFHVVVEKPLALTKSDAERIIFTALHKNRHVFAVMQNRYSPPSRWIKDLVESGNLGNINMVQINCYWNRDERYYKNGSWHGDAALDGGTLFTQFSHFIDIMYWLFGDITDIKVNLKDFNHQKLTDFEDSGIIQFEFVDGGIGVLNFSTSTWDKNFESSLTVLAENGTVKIGGQYMNKVEYCHVKDYEMPELPPANPANDYGPYKGSAANHIYLIENVVDVLKQRGTITTNALEGLKVVEIIERIYKEASRKL
jgi:predicted dehydrogenase